MKQRFRRWWRRVSSFFGMRASLYTFQHVRDFPENFRSHIVYLQGKPGQEWLAGFTCPCGCQEHIELILAPAKPPCWRLTKHPGEEVTLSPSVWRSVGCRSHFFLRKGKIVWC